MRVLHISDLHISQEHEAECRLLVEAMLRDVEEHATEAPFDFAAFTGDLAAHGKADEYELAREVLLDPIAERLGLPKERIFLAPGNHDVDRDAIRQMVEIGLASGLKSPEQVLRLLQDDSELAEAVVRLQPWRSFATSGSYGGVEGSPSSIAVAERFTVDGKSIGVVTLNSAWRCSGSEDKSRLLVGGPLAEEALRTFGDCDVRIALVHHPLDWLYTFEADQLRAEFESQGVIVLSGHEHSSDPSARRSPRGEAIYLQAGCLYSHIKYPNAYFILDIDPQDRRVLVKIRRWSEKTRLFDAATEDAPGGEQAFKLPAGGTFTDLGHPRFSTVKRMIADAAAELRVLPDELGTGDSGPVSVSDILVEPRLLSVPFKEAQAVATLTDGIAKQEIDAGRELLEKNIVVVSGEPQSGVSSALFWLLSDAYDRDASKMPAYLGLGDSRIGTAKQAATLSKAASRFGYRAEDGELPDLLLAVDDLDPARENKFRRVISFIRENPNHRFILGCSSSDAPTVSAALDDSGLAHAMAYLAPFGKSQLRLLATTVKRGGDADLDQIYGLIMTQSLPQTPFTMLALIAVTSGRVADPDDLNSTSLLEAYVNLLLGSSEFAEAERLGMNYRKRVALLGELARALYERPGWTMPIPDVEALFVKFFQDRALRIQATQVLRSLLERQVLGSDGDYVSFRHPALLQLFLGHWMLEGKKNKEEMLNDPVKHAEAIGHAAALDRSDRDLLIRVAGFVDEAIAALSERVSREQVDTLLKELRATDSWGGEQLDRTLASMPVRRSSKERDAEMDRWSEALDLSRDGLERPALTSAKDLEKATMLLSDVLRQSDLVDDPELKQEFFELATEGWILLIGLVLAEEHSEGPVRALMEEIIEKLLGEEVPEIKDALSEFMLWMSTVVIVLVAQAKLGAKSLASTVEACLSNESFTDSAIANCIAVWAEIHLGLPESPGRLAQLLSRLPHETFLRNATVAMAVNKFRSTSDDKLAREILEELAPHLVTESNARARKTALADVKDRLGKSRRVYQGGLSVQGSALTPELPAAST